MGGRGVKRIAGPCPWREVLPGSLPPETPVYFDRQPGVLRLDQNTNPRAPGVVARAAEVAHRAELHKYGSSRGARLRRALADRYGVREEEVLVGNGSDEVLDTVARAYLGPGRRAAMFRPGYDLHAFFALREGSSIRELTVEPFPGPRPGPAAAAPSSPALFDAPPGFLDGVSVLYHASPHNPLGTTLPAPSLARWSKEVGEGLVVVDEAYAEYGQDPPIGPGPLWREGLARGNVVFTRTFSKAWGLAGLRVGWGVAPAAVLQRLERTRIPYTLGTFAEELALAALEDPAFVEESVRIVRRERERLAGALRARGFQVLPSQANFLFTVPPVGGQRLWEELKEGGLLVRRTNPTPSCAVPLRISVGLPEETDLLLALLDERLGGVERALPAAPRVAARRGR